MRRAHSAGLLLLVACASGKQMPSGQDTDASTNNPDPVVDAALPSIDAPTQQMVDAAPLPDAPPPPPDACVPQAFEKLANPALDLTPQGASWVAVRDPQLYPIIGAEGIAPHSAPYKAWFGGASGQDLGTNSPVVDSLHQDITIPAMATSITITGYYLVGTQEDDGTVYDRFTLDVTQTNGTVIENVLALTDNTVAGAYTQFSKTLTQNVAGQTIRLRATSTNDVFLRTNFFVDSLSLKATHCP